MYTRGVSYGPSSGFGPEAKTLGEINSNKE